MTPLDALVQRLREKVPALGFRLQLDSQEAIAREALRWVEEQLPGREEVATQIARVSDPLTVYIADALADALLALLRERLGAGKGAGR